MSLTFTFYAAASHVAAMYCSEAIVELQAPCLGIHNSRQTSTASSPIHVALPFSTFLNAKAP